MSDVPETQAPARAPDPAARYRRMLRIMRFVAQKTGVSLDEMRSPCRKRKFVEARQIVVWLVRRKTDISFPRIAIALGGRDHATCMHAMHKLDTRMHREPAYAELINGYDEELGPMPA